MSKVLRAAALLAALNFSAVGQRVAGAGASLRLTAEIVGRRYCAGDRSDILQLRVRLRYRNAGDEKLILYRGKNLFYQTRVRGSAAGGQYEVVALNSRFNDAQAESVNAPRPGRAFVTLSAGGAYETELVVGVVVSREGSERAANSIAPGEQTLQIVASSWYESRKLGEELRERWRGAGLLWVDPVATEPLKFTVVPDEAATRCM